MDIISRGGLLMWPILLESVIALWVIIERIIFVAAVLPKRRRGLVELAASAGQGDPDSKPNPDDGLGELRRAVDKARREGGVNSSLLAMHADRLVQEAERYLSLLHIVAQSAPLLGLLGTVMGMIQAFIRIQALGGQVNPSDLAGGIWEALITTAAGLTVAIPALIAYIVFARVADRFAHEAEAAVSQIVYRLAQSGLEVA
jgi:biopolymer transport protein ExbB